MGFFLGLGMRDGNGKLLKGNGLEGGFYFSL